MNNGRIFFQHPIGLWDAEPFASVRRDLGPYAEAVYWRVMEQIKLGNGIDSLDHILTLFDDVKNSECRKRWVNKLKLMLDEKYRLFVVTKQRMVYAVDYAKLIREQNRRALLEGPELFNPEEFNAINDKGLTIND